MPNVVWTEHFQYRTVLRGFDLAKLEHILRHSTERYVDTETGRSVVFGKPDRQLLMTPYEADGETITPVTV